MGSRSLTPGTLRREYVCEEDWGEEGDHKTNTDVTKNLEPNLKITIILFAWQRNRHRPI